MGKDMHGSGRDLILGNILAFTLKESPNPRKISVKITGQFLGFDLNPRPPEYCHVYE
jgi:hypothetical protein